MPSSSVCRSINCSWRSISAFIGSAMKGWLINFAGCSMLYRSTLHSWPNKCRNRSSRTIDRSANGRRSKVSLRRRPFWPILVETLPTKLWEVAKLLIISVPTSYLVEKWFSAVTLLLSKEETSVYHRTKISTNDLIGICLVNCYKWSEFLNLPNWTPESRSPQNNCCSAPRWTRLIDMFEILYSALQ